MVSLKTRHVWDPSSLLEKSLLNGSLWKESLLENSLLEESLLDESLLKESFFHDSLLEESLLDGTLLEESIIHLWRLTVRRILTWWLTIAIQQTTHLGARQSLNSLMKRTRNTSCWTKWLMKRTHGLAIGRIPCWRGQSVLTIGQNPLSDEEENQYCTYS